MLSSRDKKIIWHPFTQEQTAGLPLAISRAKGSYLYDEHGKAYLDLISSWWVNLHGHANEQIAESIFEQAIKLEHVIFAGFTHAPAVELCEALKKCLPAALERFFFSDNGSTCVEAALKMAYQYWHNLEGKGSRNLFLCFDGGYHGDTFGAMSAGRSHFHNKFEQLFFKSIAIPYPSTFENDHDVESKEQNALAALDEQLSKFGNQIAAIILEPLVQGASGMRMCRPIFLKAVIEKVRQCGILVVFDEVMTGFGRTGTLFALDQVGVVPDFLCLSKGITGGFLPLALTVTTNQIYSAFLSDQWHKAFAHGHSYTANPLACRAAITSLQLLLSNETQAAITAINAAHKDGLQYVEQRVSIARNFRMLGTIAAFEIENISPNFKAACLDEGLLIRPLGNTVYLLPPYSTTALELEHSYAKLAKIICVL